MYTVYLAGIGEVLIQKSSVHIIGRKTYVLGRDSDRIPIRLTIDIMRAPKLGECGYCHITSYTQGKIITRCDIYVAIY